MTAFSAAVATLFADPNGSVDGVLTDTGGAVPVRVVPSKVDAEQSLGFTDARHPGYELRVPRTAVSSKPSAGTSTPAVVTIASGPWAGTYINQQTTEDRAALEWILDCRRS